MSLEQEARTAQAAAQRQRMVYDPAIMLTRNVTNPWSVAATVADFVAEGWAVMQAPAHEQDMAIITICDEVWALVEDVDHGVVIWLVR